MSRDERRATQLGVGGQRAEDQRIPVLANPPELVQPPQVDDALWRLAELAGDLHHEVRAAGDGSHAAVGGRLEQRIGLSQGGRGVDRGLERARHR